MGQGRPHHPDAGALERAMTVQLSRVDKLALITLDRSAVLNALNFELLRDP